MSMRRSEFGRASLLRSSVLSYTDESDAETVHQAALEAALIEHERIRESALKSLEYNELLLSRLRLEEHAEHESERLRLEKEHADLAAKIIELQKKSIPIPKAPPRPKTPPPPSPAELQTTQTTTPAAPHPHNPFSGAAAIDASNNVATPPAQLDHFAAQKKAENVPPSQTASAARAVQQSESIFTQQAASTSKAALPAPNPPAPRPNQASGPATNGSSASSTHLLPGVDRFVEIHQYLKHLRKSMAEEIKKNPGLKSQAGDMRRKLRTSIGQLTDVKGANKVPTAKIQEVLRDSLTMNSPPLDPSLVLVNAPPPTAEDSRDTIPSLFIYFLNHLAKAAIRQFIDEAGSRPKAAEPIGVVVVSIFAKPDFQWRGTSFIDILMAKMRVVCPVLFGIRGSDKTEEGRARQGWKKENGVWVVDQTHNLRMTGLGAGYASIALRDFSKTRMVNPWPPSLFWRSLASIVNTPEPSGTQYLVVKAMLENFEQRFLLFYGSAGKAALQAALVEFPNRDPSRTVAGSSLRTLGDKLSKDVGLHLAAMAR